MGTQPRSGKAARRSCGDSVAEAAEMLAPRSRAVRLGYPAASILQEQSSLLRTIETEILPRLTSRQGEPPPVALPAAASASVAELAEIVLTRNFSAATARIAAARSDGATLDHVCFDLLAPTARLLGQMWEEDRLDFAEVTLGLWRLQQLLREFSSAAPGEICPRPRGLSALLLPACGEQHRFGLSIVMEYFRREGWEVHGGPAASLAELRDLVRDSWFDVVGFSVGCTTSFKPLAAWIRTVRKVSRNPAIGVLVGGKLITEHPDLVAQLGADATAADGQQAPLTAERLLATLVRTSAA